MSNRAKQTAAVAVLGIIVLWCADHAWALLGSTLSGEDASQFSPSLGRVAIQALLFAVLFTWFVGPHPTNLSAIAFGALVGLLVWLPDNLPLFAHIQTFDWDLRLAAAVLGATFGIALQWAFLGYLAARLSRILA